MKTVLALLLIFGFLLFNALTARAHTSEEIDEWVEDWVVQADEALTPDLVLAHQHMVEAHQYYFNPQPFTPQRVGWGGTVEEWRPLVAGHFDSALVETAMCLIFYESKGDPNAISPTNDYGLMQIHTPLWSDHYGVTRADLLVPETNLWIAADLQRRYGWAPWSPYKRGLCQ